MLKELMLQGMWFMGLAMMVTVAACASPAPDQVRTAAAAPDCLQLRSVERTKIVDDNTILFYMNDHAVWKNSFQKCPTLHYEDGYVYETNYPQICAKTPIRVLRSGVTCALGDFAPSPSDPKSQQSASAQ